MDEKKEKLQEEEKNDNINIPIVHHNILYEIPLKEIEYSKGKKSLIRQYVDELPYQPWIFCKHYQYKSCLFGEDCWNVHVNTDYWKKNIKTNEKKEENKIIENLLLKNNQNKEDKKEVSFILVQINQNNIQKIPIEVIISTKKLIELKEAYEKNQYIQQKEYIIGIWCHMHHRSLCKFGNQCNKIHIQSWFIEKIKNEKLK